MDRPSINRQKIAEFPIREEVCYLAPQRGIQHCHERVDHVTFGMTTFTFVHVVLSLIGIVAGLIVMFGLLSGKRFDGWTAIFLLTTVLTSVTGFLLPAHHFMPSHGVGIISMVVLVVAILARYAFHLAGGWRRTYVMNAMIALYLNVFVLIAQAFQKVASLKAMAPTGSEPPFLVAQVICLVIFIGLTVGAAIKFRNEMAGAA
jgi:hypothetical protein